MTPDHRLQLEYRGTGSRHAHLVGMGGAGMAALAEVLLGRRWSLSGSDLVAPDACRAAPGVRRYVGHAADQVPDATDLVVYSSAIADDNPELLRAAERGIPALSYAQALGRLMSGRRGLAVAGTHGKSTTTAMAARILVDAGFDPTVIAGATPTGATSGGRSGLGDIVLVEACEYRANFLNLRPQDAVVLGIEPDHFDCYDSPDALQRAFSQFVARLPCDGWLLARHDCAVTRRVAAGAACRVETFAIDAGADWSAVDLQERGGRYGFEIVHGGRRRGRVNLQMPGRHNVLNALAAAALASRAGSTAEQAVQGLERFDGLHRRLETLGTVGGVTVVDDYAHHPTEVIASLAAVRAMAPGRRLWCVFQPHQASRTEHLLDELAASLQNADRVLVAEIFRAREGAPRRGDVSAADLARRTRELGADVAPCHAAEEIERFLATRLTPGDVLVTMGAGDIGRIGHGFMERF